MKDFPLHTASHARQTLLFCAREKLTCCVPTDLVPGALGFHSAFNNGRFISAGLQLIEKKTRTIASDSDHWCIVLEPGLLLPERFRERLSLLHHFLDERKLYTLRAQQTATGLDEFFALQRSNRWELGTDTQELSNATFFLFSLDYAIKRYPGMFRCANEASDNQYVVFRDEKCAVLPMVGLKLRAAVRAGWDVKGPYRPNGRAGSSSSILPRVVPTAFAALQLGICEPEATTALAAIYSKVILVDVTGVTAYGEDSLEESDREFSWQYFLSRISGCTNVYVYSGGLQNPGFIARNGLPLVPRIRPRSVAALHLAVPVQHEFLLGRLTPWLSYLRAGAWLSGIGYGYPAFPYTTSAVELLLGSPKFRTQQGGWALQWPLKTLPRRLCERERSSRLQKSEEGLVLWVWNESEVYRAIIALHAIRERWRGPLCILSWSRGVPALRIACARADAGYFSVVAEAKLRCVDDLHLEAEGELPRCARSVAAFLSLPYSPFRTTLFLTVASTLSTPARWFGALRRTRPCICSYDATSSIVKTLAYLRDDPGFKASILEWPTHQQRTMVSTIPESWGFAAIRDVSKRTLQSSRFDQPLFSQAKQAALAAAMPAHAWLPEDCTVVSGLAKGEWETMLSAWSAVQWPDKLERLIVPCFPTDIGAESSLPPNARVCPLAPEIPEQLAKEPYWIWAIVSATKNIATKRLLYIDPLLRPFPGGQLFWTRPEQDAAYCASGWSFTRFGRRVLKVPKLGPPASLFRSSWLRDLLPEFFAKSTRENFETFLYRAARRDRKRVVISDVMATGWM